MSSALSERICGHSTGEASLRDYLCSWLCMLMMEQYQVETKQADGVEVVQSKSPEIKICILNNCAQVTQ